MKLNYSCFISYCHGQQELMTRFIEQLKAALRAYLEPYFDEDICIDDERLKPGYHYNEKLAEAICQSVCMVVVYLPRYERHAYCLREYAAMEEVERRRKEMLGEEADRGTGMIIPIVLRGAEDLPPRIKDSIHYCDFSKFTTASTRINDNPESVEKIEKIALAIYEQSKKLQQLGDAVCSFCGSFELPAEAEVEPWRETPKKQAPFPSA